jgi:hypothetical protein
MRDAFSLCRVLNDDNRETHAYEKTDKYDNLKTRLLPNNVSLRVQESNSIEESTPNAGATSFLQAKMKIRMKTENISIQNLEKAIEELEKDDTHDMVAEQYRSLNNDAYEQNKELQEQLTLDNNSHK